MIIEISFDDVKAVQAIPGKSINDFTPEELEAANVWERKFYLELGVKSPFYRARFGDWRINDATPVKVVTPLIAPMPRGNFVNEDTGWTIQVSSKIERETKAHALRDGAYDLLGSIEGIVANSVLLDTWTDAKNKTASRAFIHSFYCAIQEDNAKVGIYKLFVDELYMKSSKDGTIRRAYQLKKVKLTGICGLSALNAAPTVPVSINFTISDIFRLVKENDSAFNPKLPSVNAQLFKQHRKRM